MYECVQASIEEKRHRRAMAPSEGRGTCGTPLINTHGVSWLEAKQYHNLLTLQDFVEGAGEAGVVYVSLGTVCSIGADEFQAMAAALSALPARVVWKVGKDDLPGGLSLQEVRLEDNVKVCIKCLSFHASASMPSDVCSACKRYLLIMDYGA